jgi:hypothetical protein
MPVRHLPPGPNLDHLKYQAKDLLKAHAAREAQAAQRIREFHPRFREGTDEAIFAATFRLSDAQLTIAREAGYASWARLKARVEKPTQADRWDLPHHERILDARFRQAVDLLDAGDVAGLRALLKLHPELVHQRVTFEGGNYFRNPSLLEFVAENPIRRRTLPANIADVAGVILDAGAERRAIDETLGLVATGCVTRECGVQISLIELLCAHGAEPDGAARAAAGHGEFEAVEALIRLGATVDLPLAAALGRMEDFRRVLPTADEKERQLAMAFAAQFGRVDAVRVLLDAGVDANRYDPAGAHSHSTPLHQAALAGHGEVVRLLVERGARLDLKDVLWQGTPADWARHEGRTEIEAYLRGREANGEKE